MRTAFRPLVTVLSLALALSLTGVTAPAPAQAADPVAAAVARMTVREKVGQLFWTRVYGASAHDRSMAAYNQADYGVDTPAQVVRKYRLGGVLYFAWAGNTEAPRQVARLSNGLQRTATASRPGVPLAVTIDQEGGLVQRLLAPATEWPGNMPLGATRSSSLTYRQFHAIGTEMRAVGVTTDFAPVTDVNTNPANPVIGVRSFGERADLVARLGTAATRGLQDADVSATLKHFPGHGDTEVDSHFGLPLVTYDRQTLEQVHLAPFGRAIQAADPDAIMSAHIVVQAVDPDNPATLSRPVLHGLLRRDMGFDGVIVTDSLDMAGVREKYGDDEVPVRALEAGADVLLNPPLMNVAYNAVLRAVRSGRISQARLDRSVRRILSLKHDRGLMADPYVDVGEVGAHVGTPAHRATARTIANQAATVLADGSILPLARDTGDTVAVVGSELAEPGHVSARLRKRGLATVKVATDAEPDEAQIAEAVDAAADSDMAVVLTYRAWASPGQQQLLDGVGGTGTPTLVVAARDPYDAAYAHGGAAIIATYGPLKVSLDGAVRAAFGEVDWSGRLPVTVPGPDGGVRYRYGAGLQRER